MSEAQTHHERERKREQMEGGLELGTCSNNRGRSVPFSFARTPLEYRIFSLMVISSAVSFEYD
jgi:hypothetical protein